MDARDYRLSDIDMIRGLAIALMAIDHTRDYPLVYVAWVLILVTLYPLCRWVAGVKARRRDWWLSYV